MKQYEQFSQLRVVPDLSVILRIDGRSFSQFTKELKLEKPFDDRLANLFIETSKDVLREFNPRYIYTFSDEINIIIDDIPFNGRVEKIDSVYASFISASFMKHLILYKDEFNVDVTNLRPVSFDSRIITTTNIEKYLRNRQQEAWRNCLNGYAQSMLKTLYPEEDVSNRLYKLNKSEIHDLLFDNGINISKVPTWHKRGIAVYKKKIQKKGFNPKLKESNISIKNKIYVDKEVSLIK